MTLLNILTSSLSFRELTSATLYLLPEFCLYWSNSNAKGTKIISISATFISDHLQKIQKNRGTSILKLFKYPRGTWKILNLKYPLQHFYFKSLTKIIPISMPRVSKESAFQLLSFRLICKKIPKNQGYFRFRVVQVQCYLKNQVNFANSKSEVALIWAN